MKQIRIFFCIFAKNISKCRLLLEKKESIDMEEKYIIGVRAGQFSCHPNRMRLCRFRRRGNSASLRGYAWSEEYRVAAKLVIITTE